MKSLHDCCMLETMGLAKKNQYINVVLNQRLSFSGFLRPVYIGAVSLDIKIRFQFREK